MTMGAMTMTRTWTLQCLSRNFIALLEGGMILTCTVTSLVITVAVVMSLCHTSLNSPGGDINSPRGRATFHPNLQHPPKIFPSEIQIFLTNYPIKFPPFSNKLPILPQMPNFPPVPNAPKFSIFQPRFPWFPPGS